MIKRFILTLAMLAAMLVPVSFAAPANATVDGCSDAVQQRADTWTYDTIWLHPSPSRLPQYHEIRLTATTAYWWCPNGNDPNKLKPLWTDYCYSHLDTEDGGVWFDGVKFDGAFFDDDDTILPAMIKVNDDGSRQNCERKNISFDIQKWLRMPQSPAWQVQYHVVRDGIPDDSGNMKSGGNTTKYFHPDNDTVLIDWF